MQIETKITDNRKDKSPVKVDTALFELVFSNLIGNAIKYNMPGGNVEVIINNNHHGEVEIVVADDGMGIPDEDKSKMFQDFYRSSNAKHKGIEGTGLGLSVVKEIVEQHDGTITFNSPSRLEKEGRRGTEFILTIPVS
jgi:two-component system phosphate regulon sensor histidine kinase PhoR